jgi:hypothetical protein
MAPPLRLQASHLRQGKLLAIPRRTVLRMLTRLCLPPWLTSTMILILTILIEGQRAGEI